MPTERPTYPYIPGDRGVPLFDFMTTQGGEFTVTGGSGRELNCTFGDRLMKVEDATYPRFHLSAVVDVLGTLNLDLYPRLYHKGERHPDLYAAKFIAMALAYFERKRMAINGFFASWEKGGTNYEEFMQAHKKEGRNKIEAAAQTWSARTMARHGFTVVERVAISEDGEKVVALFSKAPPNHSGL